MADRRISFHILVSLLLQLLAVASPWWYVEGEDTEQKSNKYWQGLFYKYECSQYAGCVTSFRLEEYADDLQTATQEYAEYVFAKDAVHAILPVIVCGSFLMVSLTASLNKGSKPVTHIILVVMIVVANVLQWELVSFYAKINILASKYYPDLHGFPWSLLFYGIGAAETTTVTIVAICKLTKINKSPVPQYHGQYIAMQAVQNMPRDGRVTSGPRAGNPAHHNT